jgi:F-type H+-transporting ATPase subunit a
MDLGEELSKAIGSHDVFSFTLFGYHIAITDTVIVMWIIMAAIVVFALIITASFKLIPEGKQNIAEVLVEFVNSTSKNLIGHHWRHFAPYIGTVLLFLILSNIASIFNILPNWEQLYEMTHMEIFEHMPAFAIRPPTKDVNVTAALGVMSIILVLGAGLRFKKFSEWLRSFIEPIPLIAPFKILDYFIRPLSLCFRLFGNILGAFIIMELLYIAMPIFVPAVFSIYFDLFDGILQAYIFIFLTSLYIAEAIE